MNNNEVEKEGEEKKKKTSAKTRTLIPGATVTTMDVLMMVAVAVA